MSHFKTLNQIADIISFNSDRTQLLTALKSNTIDWDSIVKIGSQHLVLPTIFYRLEQKSLLHYLPSDLKTYLSEISSINQNRNKTLLTEINYISELFNQHKINHVFLKGSALIVAGYYNNIGERMIGDIDILVDKDQLIIANNLLIAEKYDPLPQTFGYKYFGHKHLPRLVHPNNFGAVELHEYLIVKPFDNYINSANVLSNKQCVNSVNVPCPIDLLYHNALNYQINDNGYFYTNLSLRNAYDCIVILDKHRDINTKTIKPNRKISSYFHIIGLHFRDISSFSKSPLMKLKASLYLTKVKHKIFFQIWNTVIKYGLKIKILTLRFFKFIFDQNYRKDVITDRRRILKNLNK